MSVRVLKIEEIEEEVEVYDLQLSFGVSIVAEGVLVHNCSLCRDLDGQVLNAGDARYTQFTPPLHPDCRCTWVSVVEQDRNIPDVNWRDPSRELVSQFGVNVIDILEREGLFEGVLSVTGWKYEKDLKGVRERIKSILKFRVVLDLPKRKNISPFIEESVVALNRLGEEFVRLRNKYRNLGKLFDSVVDKESVELVFVWKAGYRNLGWERTGEVGLNLSRIKKWERELKSSRQDLTWTVAMDLLSIWRHELGHKVHKVMDVIEEKSLLQWLGLFQRRSKSWWEKNVSVYAATNWKEAFAESFSMYTSPLYSTTSRRRLPEEIEGFLKGLLER